MCIHLTKAHMHHSATYHQHPLPTLSARYLSQRERAGLISRQEVRVFGTSLDRVTSMVRRGIVEMTTRIGIKANKQTTVMQ